VRPIPLLLALVALLVPAFAGGDSGARGAERGLAILTAKALTVPPEGPQVVDNAVLLIRVGRIEVVGVQGELELPADYELLDVGDRWVAPGIIDLHTHIGGRDFFTNDINDMVYLTNPGLRVSTSVVPENRHLMTAVAGGVTLLLYIPGSGTNIGGHGILLKTGLKSYERMVVRDPGSLKLAQSGNPESWTVGIFRSFMNWHTRYTVRRGLGYARRWADYEAGQGPRPEKDPQWEVFRDVLSKKTQVSVHTQIFQVVLMTVTMLSEEFGLDVYIDHGSFDGWRAAGPAALSGVPAILGPRGVSAHMVVEYRPSMSVENDTDGAILGMAAKYQEAGHEMIGFNTDAPVVPAEEVSLQAAMAVRYGFDTSRAQHVRGLTIVPALAAGLADRVGSLEPGKDADLIVVDGDPADPRTTVFMTFIEGERVYDNEREKRRW